MLNAKYFFIGEQDMGILVGVAGAIATILYGVKTANQPKLKPIPVKAKAKKR